MNLQGFHFLECCRSILWYCEVKAWVCTVSQLQLWTPWVGTALLKSLIVPDFVHYLTVRWCSKRPDRMYHHSSTVHIPISCELWFTVLLPSLSRNRYRLSLYLPLARSSSVYWQEAEWNMLYQEPIRILRSKDALVPSSGVPSFKLDKSFSTL